MKRTMVLLPEPIHKRLKLLAVAKETSLAQLIREAVEGQLQEDLEDIARAEKILKSFKPGSGIRYEGYRTQRLKRKSSRL